MTRNLTFGRKIAAGFAAVVVITLVVDVVAVVTLKHVVSSKDRVINVNAKRVDAADTVQTALANKAADTRGYLLTADSTYLDSLAQDRKAIDSTLASLRQSATRTEATLLATIVSDEQAHDAAIDRIVSARKSGTPLTQVVQQWSRDVDPVRTKLHNDIDTFASNEQSSLVAARQASSNTASHASTLVELLALIGALLAAACAFLLTRSLRRQIGTAVSEVNSSSSELQATANQQASGAREQATAMNEISTTISELLATSRQIAESAQRVSQIADQTADAGRSGVDTIGKAQVSIVDIRKQVDVIVDHMLALGEKSQQIGAVLDIVTELAEQTNILAINSTIEAAGAGEAGKRFSVVADEIRKLADRVADSTKEIRSLIEVVRGAVNTTVMAIEIGSKAVDSGNEQFADVSEAFAEIADLVTTTTEAAREIELSTKQQATAVEQVNLAISNVAQSTKESEASSTQTLQTASQLNVLSKDLARLVETQSAA
ncbi:MAG TPA: methyl-accepting chemotaxis protein [Acidimicrobiia bacterium]|jgi:methyl-accepting chemotaxis protein|nr:methyl-accepting chemotaxis protein [Acidimicrobiia bacterium]